MITLILCFVVSAAFSAHAIWERYRADQRRRDCRVLLDKAREWHDEVDRRLVEMRAYDLDMRSRHALDVVKYMKGLMTQEEFVKIWVNPSDGAN